MWRDRAGAPHQLIDRMLCVAGKGVQQRHTRRAEMSAVAGHDREAVDQCGSRNQLVERVFGARRAQAAPELRDVGIDIEDVCGEIGEDGLQPSLQAARLQRIAAMADQRDAATQFANGDDRQKKRRLTGGDVGKKPSDSRIGLVRLADFADDIGVNQIHEVNACPNERVQNPHRGPRSACVPAPQQGSCDG